jgi:tetratricopeptide (TPR) repeat protein
LGRKPSRIRKTTVLVALLLSTLLAAGIAFSQSPPGPPAGDNAALTEASGAGLTGSKGCRECHERFYQLWSASFHGLAMQAFTPKLAKEKLAEPTGDLASGDLRYRADIGGETAWVVERGPKGERKYRIDYAMGGKNVFYFLTPLEKGRLQVLPVAYDVRKKEWFPTTASHLRPFSDNAPSLPWTDPLYTFNTSCHGCHVSQVSTNYDLSTDSYRTTWTEPGINCETCHNPGGEHVRAARETPKGEPLKDLKIIVTKKFTVEQHNSNCGPCHAKMSPVSPAFTPGERFFDHFDLTTLEDTDFSPDGRDLGENYTYTRWRMSPCVKSGKLSCLHCHTSSGRYRFKKPEDANKACLPCHEERVANASAHSHHPAESEASRCISCHMPMTEFARMRRSDHSMLPPTPAATIAYKSPNACNLCHADKSAAWADNLVRAWRPRDYQAPVLRQAGLVAAARKREWKNLPEMLAYLEEKDHDEVVATSLIRLLRACPDDRRLPAFVKALSDPSPLVRGAAAAALAGDITPQSIHPLLGATRDDYRLVRVRAAEALAGVPSDRLGGVDRQSLESARKEAVTSFQARPDDHASHYNLGNLYLAGGDPKKAIDEYGISSRLRPDSVPPLVNASMAYYALGEKEKAEESLRRAVKIAPENVAARLNLGMLLGEMGKEKEAEKEFRAAAKADPKSAQAAYNLCVVTSKDRVDEALKWCRKATNLRPEEPRYGYTYAFVLDRKGETAKAIPVLRKIVDRNQPYSPAYVMLGTIYEKQGKTGEAKKVYRKAANNAELPEPDRAQFRDKLQSMGK